MNPIPGTAIASTTDRLTDAAGDVAVLAQSITVAGQALTDVLALPPGFGIAQVGPFFTYVQSSDAGATVVCFGDNNAETTGEYFVSLGGGFVGSLMLAPGVIDFAASDDGPAQDALGYPLRYTAAAGAIGGGTPQTCDLEQWGGVAGNLSGIDCNANLYATLYDINQDVYPAAGSACTPREGMLGWNYDTHTLTAYDGSTWQPVMRNGEQFYLQNGGQAIYLCYGGQAISALGPIVFAGLPTSDPLVSGQLWNSSGTVKVSAG